MGELTDEGPRGTNKMNALEAEIECMDPVDYWRMHRAGWHDTADRLETAHYPALSDFYHDVEDAAGWFLTDVLGVSLN